MKHSQEMWEPFLPTPGSLHYFAQVAAVWGWPLSPQARRTQRDPVSATNSGAGRSGGVDPAGVEGRPSRRPAPDAGWGGLLAAPCRRVSTAEPQGCGGCLRATRRSQFGRREPALSAPPAGRIPTRSPRARAGRGPGCGPESLEPASWPWARWLAKGRRLPPAPAALVAPTWSPTSLPTRSSRKTPSTSCECTARPPALC